MKARLHLVSVFLVLCCASSAPVLVTFWAAKGVTAPPGVLESNEHPCGRTFTVETNRIPSDSAIFEWERVREIDEQGKVLREWPVPIDCQPVALDGPNLLLRQFLTDGVFLVVTPTGRLSFRSQTALAIPKSRFCPPTVRTDESAYLRCVEARDLRTGQAVTLLWEGPCT